jgi:hypothetical protein
LPVCGSREEQHARAQAPTQSGGGTNREVDNIATTTGPSSSLPVGALRQECRQD